MFVSCNLRGYDGYFIIQEIGKQNIEVSAIPTNIEKFFIHIGEKYFPNTEKFKI